MVKWVYHTLISPSLTSISPSFAWSQPSFAHLAIIEKLHRLNWKKLAYPGRLSYNQIFCKAKSSVLGLSRFKYIYFIHEEKKLTFFFICSLRNRGGGVLATSANMSSKNVSFFGRLSLWIEKGMAKYKGKEHWKAKGIESKLKWGKRGGIENLTYCSKWQRKAS